MYPQLAPQYHAWPSSGWFDDGAWGWIPASASEKQRVTYSIIRCIVNGTVYVNSKPFHSILGFLDSLSNFKHHDFLPYICCSHDVQKSRVHVCPMIYSHHSFWIFPFVLIIIGFTQQRYSITAFLNRSTYTHISMYSMAWHENASGGEY